MAAKILCVGLHSAMLESRCAVLKVSGYDATPALPQQAENLMRSQKFDMIVISRMSDYDPHKILQLAEGAEVLVLNGLTMPRDLLASVTERLNGI
jgi:2,4-dienoyl-CoA reductase-like NADH-dependent reductase (Old Yellow Enzyme family)